MIGSQRPPVPYVEWVTSIPEDVAPWRQRKHLRDTITPEVMEAVKQNASLLHYVNRLYTHPFFSFEPRADTPGIDEQTGYTESEAYCTVCIGGNGCLAPWQTVFDPVARRQRRMDEIDGPWHVWAIDPVTKRRTVAKADRPWIKGRAPLFRWITSTGDSFVATSDHRILTPRGWMRVCDAYGASFESLLAKSFPSLLGTNSGIGLLAHRASGRHCLRTVADCQCGCSACPHLCDAPLLYGATSGQCAPPLLADALGHTPTSWRTGGQRDEQAHSRSCRSSFRHSTIRCVCPSRPSFALGSDGALPLCSRSFVWGDTRVPSCGASTVGIDHLLRDWQLLGSSSLRNIGGALETAAKEMVAETSGSLGSLGMETKTIVGCEYITTTDFYDIGVPGFGNYELAGMIHANSGKSFLGAQRTAQFLASNRPPARDTPFWCIGTDFNVACKTCWAQKLCDIIPYEWIDWERITWRNTAQNFPATVPLKPWDGRPSTDHGRKNWVLEFKSCEQGRAAFQGVAVGGAWFTEQFPEDIFEEVERGLREYAGAVKGPITLEFTPIDPAKAIFMEEKYETWKAGDNPTWEFFKFHTRMAKAAGHVDSGWFGSFFDNVSDEMLETRMAGAFASYAGVIYKSFNRTVHIREFDVPDGVHHRRGVDWGSSEEHAFVVLWGYKDSAGIWYVYDEFYTTDQASVFDDWIDEIQAGEKSPHNGQTEPRTEWKDDGLHGATYVPPDQGMGRRQFVKRGIQTSMAYTNVYQGIEYVRQALKIHPWGPGLVIHPRCVNLIREIKTYRWMRSSGEGTNPAAAKPEPLKLNDHAVDALRYMIASETHRHQKGAKMAALKRNPKARGGPGW